jgi:hypothetical protein
MRDEKGSEKADTDESTDTSLHAYKEGREEDVQGTIPSGAPDAEEATNTGGATSGGAPRSDEEGSDEEEETSPGHGGGGETVDDTPEPEEGSGEKGLGSDSDVEDVPPNNPDPSTKGATKGTEGAL